MERTDSPRPYESLLAHTEWLGRLSRTLVPAADREDLVQDVLLSALRRQGEPRHLRGWLATMARNLASRHRRRDANRRTREQAAAQGREAHPPTADTVETFATHRAVVNAVMDLDEPYRTAVLLRFWEDLPPRAVARRTGVPVETARTRIKRGVDRLRAVLDQRHGGRGAWAAPLLQIDAVREALLAGTAASATTASVLPGALVMKKTALAAVAVALFVATVAMFTLGGEGSRAGGADPSAAARAATADPTLAGARDERAEVGNARAEAARDPGSGTLLARVVRPDGSRVEDVGVYLRAVDAGNLGVDLHTGANGEVTFVDLEPGDYRVLLDRGLRRIVSVRSGLRAECLFEVPVGITVHGRVVTMNEQPVPGARVYAFDEGHHDLMVFLTETDTSGAFLLRDVAPGLELFSRADGWQPTGRRQGRTVQGAPGDTVEVEIELGARGHALHGRVLDERGAPAPRAWVGIAVDEDSRKWIEGMQELRAHDGNAMLDRETFFVRADEEGHFATTEVPWGDTAILARGTGAQDHLVGAARVRVDKGAANAVVVHLRPGGAVFGTVCDEEGEPYAGIELLAEFRGTEQIGELERGFGHHLADRTCVTAGDGSYRLDGLFEADHGLSRLLPTDELHIQRFAVLAGQELRLDLTVPRTWQLRVKVQDPAGDPLEDWAVILSGGGSIPYRLVDRVRTGADGVFVATGLRAERYVFSVHAPDPEGDRPVRRFPSFVRAVTRGEGEVIVTAIPPTGSLAGRVLDPAGAPVAGVRVSHALAGFEEREWASTDREGRFRIARLPAGDYSLELVGSAFPSFTLSTELGAGESRELGDIVLVAPAMLEVELRSGDGRPVERPELWLSRPVTTEAGAPGWRRAAGLHRVVGDERWRNDPVEAGSYRLHVTGDDVAPWVQDVRLVAGTPKRLRVTLPRGVAQEFEVLLADQIHGERGDGYAWLAFDDAQGRQILDHYFRGPVPDPSRMLLRTTVHLLPGSYRVRARGRTGTAEARITVPDGGGPPIRIVLR